MTIDDKIRDEKSQYDTGKAAPNISPLLSGNINKYNYLTGEEILPSQQHRLIQEAKQSYSPLAKAFEQKTIEKHYEKQLEALQSLKSIEQQIQLYQPQIKLVLRIYYQKTG